MAQGFGKQVYQLKGYSKKADEYTQALALIPANRWIPIVLMHRFNLAYCTQRQVRWIAQMIELKTKVVIEYEPVNMEDIQG